jgi:CheY-like chemotaxis protein
LASGLPREGKQAGVPRAGELARTDLPTCRLDDRVRDLEDRITAAGWDRCIVVNDERVVLGVLRKEAMIFDPNAAAEQLMEPGPATVRPSWSFEKTSEYLQKQGLKNILVTTSDGTLMGIYFQELAASEMASFRASEAAGQSQAADQRGVLMAERRPRILYADDNRDNCEFIVRDLVDYEVTCAMTAEDALRQGESGGFDLILLDYRLPGATGIDLCKGIRAFDSQSPILILSGPDEQAVREKAEKAGAQDYWPTPVDLESVGREIRRLLKFVAKPSRSI